jgi:prepilin-type processing-associated H-X9-DG protein
MIHTPHLRTKAFTLVEVLVTTMLICGLAALLFPAFGRTLSRSREARCLSGLRQLQQANILYAQDNDGKYVPTFANDSGGQSSWWMTDRAFVTLLGRPTTVTAAIPANLRCPLAKVSGEPGWGYNSTGLSGGSGEPNAVRQLRQAQIARPSQTIAFIDALDRQVFSSSADKYTGEEKKSTHAVAYRHGNKNVANAVFWDGHAESLSRELLLAEKARYFESLNP